MDLSQQRLLDEVELVSGIGQPDGGTACIMSFVARIAGQGHTDRPRCASPVIRAFAIPLNDHMPHEIRQRLKVFAPRIVGTNDGMDHHRTALLLQALSENILPFTSSSFSHARTASLLLLLRCVWSELSRVRIYRRIARLQRMAAEGRAVRGTELATATAQLLAACGREAQDACAAEWYWNTAIRLLDQLCDVGPTNGSDDARRGAAEDLPASGVQGAERLTWILLPTEEAWRQREGSRLT